MSDLSLELSKTLQEQADKKLVEYAESLVGKKVKGFTIRKFYRNSKQKKSIRLKADRRVEGKLHQISLNIGSTMEEIEEKVTEYIKDKGLEEK